MKKTLIIFMMIMVGIISCSKKEEHTEQSENETNNQTLESVEVEEPQNVQSENTESRKSGYRANLEERMNHLLEKVQPDLDSGVISQMESGTNELYDAWKKEMDTTYDLLEKKLPENEKKELQSSQETWKSNLEEDKAAAIEEFGEGIEQSLMSRQSEMASIADRTMELAAMYDKTGQ